MPRPSLLYTKPPESSEGLELPLKSLTECFEVTFTENGILWIFVGVGQCHEDNPSLEVPKGASVDASQTSEEVPTACPREAAHLLSDTTTATPTTTEPLTSLGILEGECRYRPSYGGGDVGYPLMCTLQRRHISLGFCWCGPI